MSIESALENYTNSDGGQGWYMWKWEADDAGEDVPEVGKVRMIKSFGGHEGAGEHTYLIFEITDAEGVVKLYEKDGYYASFGGTEWDGDFYEVVSAEKTITVFERVK